MPRLLALAAACALATAAGAQEVPLLWQVTDDRGHAMWLVGSMHALTPADSVLHPATAAAYEAARVVAFEVDPATMDADVQRLMMRHALDARRLHDALPPATYAALAARLAPLGMTPDRLEGLRPWAIALLVGEAATARVGLEAVLGLDARLHARAVADGKPVAALETVAEQMAALASGTDAEHLAALDETLASFDRLADDLDALLAAWRLGDAPALARIVKAGAAGGPALKRMLTVRNRAWMVPLERLLADGQPALVVVGAAHLVGPDSLPALLAARGHTVVRVEGGG